MCLEALRCRSLLGIITIPGDENNAGTQVKLISVSIFEEVRRCHRHILAHKVVAHAENVLDALLCDTWRRSRMEEVDS